VGPWKVYISSRGRDSANTPDVEHAEPFNLINHNGSQSVTDRSAQRV